MPKPFRLPPGYQLASKYRIEECVGVGWEGEVYRVTEARTGITRAAKLFYPERNRGNRTLRAYARKLEALRRCPLTINYHHSETIDIDGTRAACLVSEFVLGKRLGVFRQQQPGKRLTTFEGLRLLHHLASGLESIHAASLYHGDLHEDNVLIQRVGIDFEIKVFDFFDRGRCSRLVQQEDVRDAIQLFRDTLGGAPRYTRFPPEIRWICAGLRRDLIRQRFPTASALRHHLEHFEWQ